MPEIVISEEWYWFDGSKILSVPHCCGVIADNGSSFFVSTMYFVNIVTHVTILPGR